MRGFLRDQRGVSAIVGFILVIALVTIAMGAYLAQQVPQDWRDAEWTTMQEVKSSFLELRKKIANSRPGDATTVKVRMGTPAPTAMLSATTTASLDMATAKDVGDAGEAEYGSVLGWRGVGTYVQEANPTMNFTSEFYDNNHLYVSTTRRERIWTFLKFDLSDLYFYDHTNHVFYSDATVTEARLMLYVNDLDLTSEPENVMQIRVPTQIEVWGAENDNWDEGITWSDVQNRDNTADVKLENTDINDEYEFVSWDVTNYVKSHFEKHRGWGKWYQTEWSENRNGENDVGKLSSGYDMYSSDTGATRDNDNNLTGTGVVTSMIFDTGDKNSFWENIMFTYDGSPTVGVRFDNDPSMAGAAWDDITWGENPDNYARYAQYRVNPNGGTFYNITLEYTAFVSFVLREPVDWDPGSTLRNRVAFSSVDNTQADLGGFAPVLRVAYARLQRPGYSSEGLINFGHIRYKSRNEYFPSLYYVYEGGMVYVERDPGWYAVMLEEPPNLVTISAAEGNNVRITVTRYQIEEGSVDGESTAGSGYTSIRVQQEEEEFVVPTPTTPNRSQVKISIWSDQPAIWRDYLERLAAQVNYILSGGTDWDTYGEHVWYDYESVSLTIYGKNFDPLAQDIYYTERIIWLDTTVGFFFGGRT